MKTKKCSKCKIEKATDDFYKEKRTKSGLMCRCKICDNILNKNNIKNSPWRKNLESLRKRCNYKKNHSYKYYGGKGIQAIICLEEIKELWFRDKAYLMDIPSIDRKNSNGDYTFKNCRFIEQGLNSTLSNISTSHRVLQYDLDGIFIKEWINAVEIEKELTYGSTCIRNNCRGKSKQAFGYIWKYKENK